MTNETKRAAVIAVIEQAMEVEYLKGMHKPDFARWAAVLYSTLEAMAAADEGADLTDRKNAICYSGFNAEGKHIAGGIRSSFDINGELSLMNGFLELEQAHRLRQVEIKPHRLGTLWVSSAPPTLGGMSCRVPDELATLGSTVGATLIGVDLAQAEDQTAIFEATPESMILEQAQRLIDRADSYGVVVTIQTYPLGPLAMGNYVMLPAVRPRQAKHLKPCGRIDSEVQS